VNLSVVVRPEAQADLLAARDWYEQQQPDLDGAFVEAVEEFFAHWRVPGNLCSGAS
jgi:hypothetical protein